MPRDYKLSREADRIDTGFKEIRSEQKSDFRWLLSILIAGFSALAGLIGHALHLF